MSRFREARDIFEAELIREALAITDSISEAADYLGITRQHLHGLMNKHGIRINREVVQG